MTASIKVKVWVHKTNLVPHFFIEVPVSIQKKVSGHVYVLGISILPLYDCSIGFWNCSDSMIFGFFFVVLLQVLLFNRVELRNFGC